MLEGSAWSRASEVGANDGQWYLHLFDASQPDLNGAEDGVHDIYRSWRKIVERYGSERVLIGEAWVEPLSHLAQWVRPDEPHRTFNFAFLATPWHADALRDVIHRSIEAFRDVGAPSIWVLSSHDVIRHATRLGIDNPGSEVTTSRLTLTA